MSMFVTTTVMRFQADFWRSFYTLIGNSLLEFVPDIIIINSLNRLDLIVSNYHFHR